MAPCPALCLANSLRACSLNPAKSYHMPSLNFLKKKRTREDKPDPSVSQPSSPVTSSSSSRAFDHRRSGSLARSLTQTSGTTSATSTAATSTTPATRKSSTLSQIPILAGNSPQMSQGPQAAAPPAGLAHTPSPSQPSAPQHLPSINNLINNSQTDGKKLSRICLPPIDSPRPLTQENRPVSPAEPASAAATAVSTSAAAPAVSADSAKPAGAFDTASGSPGAPGSS